MSWPTDMAACEGTGCGKKHTCARHQGHLDNKDDDYKSRRQNYLYPSPSCAWWIQKKQGDQADDGAR